jgi:Crp-like helix-turn-helix domain
MHDREQLFRNIWDNYTDKYGMISVTQQELASCLGINYQRLSVVMSEFVKMGYAKKFRHKFQLKNPDGLDWGSDFKARRRRLTS